MNKVTFSIKDEVLGEELSPSNLTLPLLREFSEQVALFVRGSTRKDLTEIKTGIEKGSLALAVDNETGVINDVVEDYRSMRTGDGALNRLDPARARIIEMWQRDAKRHTNRVYKFWLDDDKQDEHEVVISSETDYRVDPEVWADVELYLYGRIYDLGGKTSPNVHLELENGKTITISSDASLLVGDGENRLYRRQLVRIGAKKSLTTGELRSEKLISFERYTTDVDDDLLTRIQQKARVAWSDVTDATNWVENLRGNSV